jgi:hypothetical protein
MDQFVSEHIHVACHVGTSSEVKELSQPRRSGPCYDLLLGVQHIAVGAWALWEALAPRTGCSCLLQPISLSTYAKCYNTASKSSLALDRGYAFNAIISVYHDVANTARLLLSSYQSSHRTSISRATPLIRLTWALHTCIGLRARFCGSLGIEGGRLVSGVHYGAGQSRRRIVLQVDTSPA